MNGIVFEVLTLKPCSILNIKKKIFEIGIQIQNNMALIGLKELNTTQI